MLFFKSKRLRDKIDIWSVLTCISGLSLIGPFVALFWVASGDSSGLWNHLFQTVFPRYVLNTLLLMGGVACVALIFGITTAWIIARFKFPGSTLFEWCLLLPATVPAYIIAYTYTDLLEYAGPLQGFLREYFGWRSARDYWFPEIRSMGGAILVMASVLYPYIYLLARTAFRLTPLSYFEAAKLHNRSFYLSVDLPLARPAIAAGLALVLMEVISDFGTVEYFAIETLTLGIFNVWLGMNNLAAAAQIAIFAFIFILGLLYMEWKARSRQRFHALAQSDSSIPRIRTTLPATCLCIVVCSIPIVLGFVLPVCVLLGFIFDGSLVFGDGVLLSSSLNSLLVAGLAAISVTAIASVMVLTVTYRKHPWLRVITTIAATGYAFPGVVLAIAVVSFSGVLETIFGALISGILGPSLGGFLIGGIGLLIFGYVTRYLAIGVGAMKSGVNRISPDIMNASFVLGRDFGGTMMSLGPPLFKNSILVAGLLVFVDVMKELPITLLLRPFNFETLSTLVYQFAKDELLEQAAPAAIMIVLAGLIPVWIMNASQRD
ncbi:MAG: iron ABC transporter permease [Rhodospirillaceae bacterium]